MFGLGYQELLIILLIVLLIFGGKKLPEVARGLGRGLREFRRARDDLGEALREEEEQALRTEREKTKAKEPNEEPPLTATKPGAAPPDQHGQEQTPRGMRGQAGRAPGAHPQAPVRPTRG